MFHNENAFTAFRGEIMLPLEHGAVYYDGMADVSYALPVREEQGKKYVEIELLPYNACVILDRDSSGLLPYRKLSEELSACGVQKNLDGAWNYGITTEKKFPELIDSVPSGDAECNPALLYDRCDLWGYLCHGLRCGAVVPGVGRMGLAAV